MAFEVTVSPRGMQCPGMELETRLGRGDTETYVMILSFRTDRSGQTVQTQIILLLEEQSDQGLHCLLFHLHLFAEIPKGLGSLFELKVDYSKVFGARKFRNFTVLICI